WLPRAIGALRAPQGVLGCLLLWVSSILLRYSTDKVSGQRVSSTRQGPAMTRDFSIPDVGRVFGAGMMEAR
ncbi:MAG: hypothetical protein LBH56_00660, partial [Coriobacteriales bacterium]|nr:hypothetical protein [Coriobacteriales bacterium]